MIFCFFFNEVQRWRCGRKTDV